MLCLLCYYSLTLFIHDLLAPSLPLLTHPPVSTYLPNYPYIQSPIQFLLPFFSFLCSLPYITFPYLMLPICYPLSPFPSTLPSPSLFPNTSSPPHLLPTPYTTAYLPLNPLPTQEAYPFLPSSPSTTFLTYLSRPSPYLTHLHTAYLPLNFPTQEAYPFLFCSPFTTVLTYFPHPFPSPFTHTLHHSLPLNPPYPRSLPIPPFCAIYNLRVHPFLTLHPIPPFTPIQPSITTHTS